MRKRVNNGNVLLVEVSVSARQVIKASDTSGNIIIKAEQALAHFA